MGSFFSKIKLRFIMEYSYKNQEVFYLIQLDEFSINDWKIKGLRKTKAYRVGYLVNQGNLYYKDKKVGVYYDALNGKFLKNDFRHSGYYRNLYNESEKAWWDFMERKFGEKIDNPERLSTVIMGIKRLYAKNKKEYDANDYEVVLSFNRTGELYYEPVDYSLERVFYIKRGELTEEKKAYYKSKNLHIINLGGKENYNFITKDN